MAQKKAKKPVKPEVENAEPEFYPHMQPQVFNALADLLGFGSPSISSSQLSQLDSLFSNNRWYLISNQRQLLSESYVEQGLIQTIVDVPVDDAYRGGLTIETNELDEYEIADLLSYMEETDMLLQITQGVKWTRLFGGGGVLIMTDQKPDTPLDLKKITEKSRLELRGVDLWELFSNHATLDDDDVITPLPDSEFFDFHGQKVHKSRVLTMKGKIPPSFIRPRLRGWGFSVCEALVSSINQYLKANNLIFEVLDEFKLDIFKVTGYNQALATKGGTQKINDRAQMVAQQKNFQNMITIDGSDEYVQKQLSFGGIADIMKEIRVKVAADMRMPMTKLFGLSASGFNSGEDDIEVYNGMVRSEVREKSKRLNNGGVKLACQKLFGKIPGDLRTGFHPLRELSSEQEEQVKTSKLNRVVIASDKGFMSPKESMECINRDNLLPIKVKISDDLKIDPEQEEEDEGGSSSSGGR